MLPMVSFNDYLTITDSHVVLGGHWWKCVGCHCPVLSVGRPGSQEREHILSHIHDKTITQENWTVFDCPWKLVVQGLTYCDQPHRARVYIGAESGFANKIVSCIKATQRRIWRAAAGVCGLTTAAARRKQLKRTIARAGFSLSDYTNMWPDLPRWTATAHNSTGNANKIRENVKSIAVRSCPSIALQKNNSVPPPRANVSWEKWPALDRDSSCLSAGFTRRSSEPPSSSFVEQRIQVASHCKKNTLIVDKWKCLPVRVAELHRAPPSWTPHSPSHRREPPLSGCLQTNPTS